MKASSFTIIVAFIAISLVGCALVPLLPVKLAPSRNLPSLTVSFSMPNNSARTVEAEVTSRLESILARVSGVKSINSKSYNGGGRVSIDLDRHADLDMVRFEVSALVRQAWGDMPDGVTYPSISPRSVEKESSRPKYRPMGRRILSLCCLVYRGCIRWNLAGRNRWNGN